MIALYCFISLVTFDQVDEDAFIYFRVAANIADGYGYVFNRGGEHVESGSSLLWQYLLAFVCLLRLDVVFFARFLGVVAGCSTLYLVYKISCKLIYDGRVAVLPALLVAVSYPFFNASRGLETSFFALTVMWLAYFVVEERFRRYWYVAALTVAMSRSEGFIALPGLAAFFLFESFEHARLKRLALELMLVGLVLAATYVWRFFYFHDLVPHAYYAKIQGDVAYSRDAALLFMNLTYTWIPLAVGALAYLSKATWSRDVITLFVLGLPFAYWGASVQGISQYNRHLLVPLCFGFLLAGRGFGQLLERRRFLLEPIVRGCQLVALWFAIGSPNIRGGSSVVPNTFATALQELYSYPRRVARNFIQFVRGEARKDLTVADYHSQRITTTWGYLLGDFIRKRYPEGITVVFDQAGQTPWYAGLDKPFIDPLGLGDRVSGFAMFNHALASNPAAGGGLFRRISSRMLSVWNEPARNWDFPQAADHIFAARPHLIVLGMFSQPKAGPDGTLVVDDSHLPGVLAAHPRLKTDYVARQKWWLTLYERRDMSPHIRWEQGEDALPGTNEFPPLAKDWTELPPDKR